MIRNAGGRAEDAIRSAIIDLKKKRGEAIPDLGDGGGGYREVSVDGEALEVRLEPLG